MIDIMGLLWLLLWDNAMVNIMGLLWLLLWDCYDWCHRITIIITIIITILVIILVITSLGHDYYYYFARLIYSIFLIPLHTTWDTPTYIRNFLYHEIILARFLDYLIKINWYDLNIILYRGIISTPYIPDYTTPFRLVIKSLSNRSTLI